MDKSAVFMCPLLTWTNDERLIDKGVTMMTSLLTGIRIRLYAVLFYADRFCRWLLTDSPRWLRWLSNLSIPKKRANREREDHIYFESHKALVPFFALFTLFLMVLVLRLPGGVIVDLLTFGDGIGFFVFLAVMCGLTFWIEHKVMGAEEVQRSMLKKMKKLPRERLFWLMVQANMGLVVLIVTLFYVLIW